MNPYNRQFNFPPGTNRFVDPLAPTAENKKDKHSEVPVDPTAPTEVPADRVYQSPRPLVPPVQPSSPTTTGIIRTNMGWNPVDPTAETKVRTPFAHKLGLGYPEFLLRDYVQYLPKEPIVRKITECTTMGRDYEVLRVDIALVDPFISRLQCEIWIDHDVNGRPCFKLYNMSETQIVVVDNKELQVGQSTQLGGRSCIRFDNLSFGEEFNMNYIEFRVISEICESTPCDKYVVEVFADPSATVHEGALRAQRALYERAPAMGTDAPFLHGPISVESRTFEKPPRDGIKNAY